MAKHNFLGIGVLAVCMGLGAVHGCGDSDSDSKAADGGDGAGDGGDGGEQQGASKDIVETAVAAGSFTTLAGALEKAGLVEALKGEGPFTVFAPTDAAFAKLDAGLLESLSKDDLAKILTYHVVDGEIPSSAVEAGPVKMLSGITAFLGTTGGVTINGAKVTTADIEASNGVIHVIDTVILPPNLVQAAELAGGFTTLVGAVGKAGLAGALSDASASLTVFAPTDDAFAALPDGTLAGLSDAQLANVLKYHVVAEKVLSTDLEAGDLTMLNGGKVTVAVDPTVTIGGAKVLAADIVTTNGVIHVIDKVLLPSD